MHILTNSNRVQHTKKGENPLLILPFTYYSLKIKFVPFLKSWPVTIPCKGKTINWTAKVLIR